MLNDLTAMEEILAADPGLAQEMYSYSFQLTEPEAILADLTEQCSQDFQKFKAMCATLRKFPRPLENILSPAFYLTVAH